MMRIVTPSLAIGEAQDSVLFSPRRTASEAASTISLGLRALVADVDTARETLLLLGVSEQEAARLLDNALDVESVESIA